MSHAGKQSVVAMPMGRRCINSMCVCSEYSRERERERGDGDRGNSRVIASVDSQAHTLTDEHGLHDHGLCKLGSDEGTSMDVS